MPLHNRGHAVLPGVSVPEAASTGLLGEAVFSRFNVSHSALVLEQLASHTQWWRRGFPSVFT